MQTEAAVPILGWTALRLTTAGAAAEAAKAAARSFAAPRAANQVTPAARPRWWEARRHAVRVRYARSFQGTEVRAGAEARSPALGRSLEEPQPHAPGPRLRRLRRRNARVVVGRQHGKLGSAILRRRRILRRPLLRVRGERPGAHVLRRLAGAAHVDPRDVARSRVAHVHVDEETVRVVPATRVLQRLAERHERLVRHALQAKVEGASRRVIAPRAART